VAKGRWPDVSSSFFFLSQISFTNNITGYSDYQIYLLLSCAPVQGHVAGIVDIPNACTTIGLPMDIFDFDISPHVPAEKRDLGSCAFAGKK
jgi:formamidase